MAVEKKVAVEKSGSRKNSKKSGVAKPTPRRKNGKRKNSFILDEASVDDRDEEDIDNSLDSEDLEIMRQVEQVLVSAKK